MNRYARNLVLRVRRSTLLPILLVIFGLSWLSGFFDHALETSFSEFTWHTSGNDVYSDTHKLINDEKSSVQLLNSYESLHTLHNPHCTGQQNDLPNNLLIIVKSSVANSKNRDVIRGTWGQEHVIDDFNVRTVFVVGRFPSDREHKSMKSERESQIHNDMIVADMVDSYRNNTEKLLHSLRYAHSPKDNCPTPDFVLLIDDDYMLSIHNLVRLLDQKSSQDLVYEGWRFDTTPFRFKLHKHAVSLSDYPFDAYPPYISAGCVLLSRASLELFFQAAKLVVLYPFDDIYAGILAYFLKLRPTHNEKMIFWTRQVSHEEWLNGEVIAAHGYDPQRLEDEYPLVRFAVPG